MYLSVRSMDENNLSPRYAEGPAVCLVTCLICHVATSARVGKLSTVSPLPWRPISLSLTFLISHVGVNHMRKYCDNISPKVNAFGISSWIHLKTLVKALRVKTNSDCTCICSGVTQQWQYRSIQRQLRYLSRYSVMVCRTLICLRATGLGILWVFIK